ncbi:unnamed protein product [Pieris brassicae]|uniref:Uncharacterized protein n=1 Tax=Pieris brassicae TaxID=7116 RepID=A0A9P0TI34_PIEBR|nr:unnamed protein product [Pieris brassicae]
MDVPEDRFYGSHTPDRSDTNSPRSHMSSPNSTSSINVTDQSLAMSQHQQNLETLNRMGMFFHAQQMHLNQSFDAVKSRLGLTQVPSVSQGPRHTIDAILGLNGTRQRVSEFEQRREDRDRECEAVPVSPGAIESAEVGFEPTPSERTRIAHTYLVGKVFLESGALDRSAILTDGRVTEL